MIRISWGTTRFVVLVGTVAIKMVRPRPLWVLRRLARYLITGVAPKRLLAYADNPLESAAKHLFAGVAVNRREYRLWQEFPHHFMVPTLYSLRGIVNIQMRGQAISEEELALSHPFRSSLKGMTPDAIGDMVKAMNFCRYEGHICLLDYGSEDTFALFSQPEIQHHMAA